VNVNKRPFVGALLMALGPAIGIGIARFAYGLVLPAMKSDLGWSYFQSGLMNTINALGYLAGAVLMGGLTRRFGVHRTFQAGIIVTIVAVLLVVTTRNFALLGTYRLLSGLSGAAIFVAGGTLASDLADATPSRRGAILSIFYAGPGLGIALTAVSVPAVFALYSTVSWQIAWLVLGGICLIAGATSLAFRHEMAHRSNDNLPATSTRRLARFWKILLGYTLFGAGSIGYMTFMVTNLREGGMGGDMVALFWLVIGLSSVAAPIVWSGAIGGFGRGNAFALLAVVNATGAALPLLSHSLPIIIVSAVIFGSSFFSVVATTTAFAARNASRNDLPKAIASFTIAFGGGQAIGPLVIGLISDHAGSVRQGLMIGVAAIAIGAGVGLAQNDVGARTV
jgi:predicted MFS family arabinose efflux permease